MELDLTALLGDISIPPAAAEKKAAPPAPAGAQITLLEGSESPPAAVWTGEGWAEYQAIYSAVEAYHRRHKDMSGTLAAWEAALADLQAVLRQLNNAPLAVRLLIAVYGELERTVPPPPAGDGEDIDITKCPAYAK